jgi:hypothetical protein
MTVDGIKLHTMQWQKCSRNFKKRWPSSIFSRFGINNNNNNYMNSDDTIDRGLLK